MLPEWLKGLIIVGFEEKPKSDEKPEDEEEEQEEEEQEEEEEDEEDDESDPAKLKAARDKERSVRKSLDKKLKAQSKDLAKLKKAEEERKKKSKSAEEQVKTEKEQAEARSKARWELLKSNRIDLEINKAAQKFNFVDTDDVLRLIDRDEIEVEEDEEEDKLEVDVESVKRAVKTLAEAKPHLVGSSNGEGKGRSGSKFGGGRKGSDDSLDEDALREKYGALNMTARPAKK